MTIRVKIPRDLNKIEFKQNIACGLYSLAVGDCPKMDISTEDPVTAKINLKGCAKKYFEELRPSFSSERSLIRHALAAVKQLPEHCRCQL